jgi:predicted metal-dependent hydrolase
LEAAAPSRSYGVEAAQITAALAAVRRRLGDAAYDRAWTAGAARTLEEAADDAMRLLDPGPGST